MFIRVATFGLRLNSLCFPCVHNQFPCVFQYKVTSIFFYKWFHHPLQPSFPPFYSTITLQVKLSTTRTHYHVNREKLHHLVATLIAKCSNFSMCCHNFSCVRIKLTKFPMFSLSGKVNFQIPLFPCAVVTLFIYCPSFYQTRFEN